MSLKEIKGPVVLEIPSDPAALFLVRGLVKRLVARVGFDQETVDRLELAVDEACSNVIRHAYGNTCGGRIVVTLLACEDRVEFHIRDFAACSNPTEFKSRDLTEVRPGGLGIHFMRSAVDQLHYDTLPEGGTLLRMVKYRTRGEQEEDSP